MVARFKRGSTPRSDANQGNTMELQEIFTKVRDHLLAQKVRSYDPDRLSNVCLYRGPGGLKCALGCLIPDDKEVPVLFNSLGIDKVLAQDPDFLGFKVSDEAYSLLAYLQNVHDRSDPNGWECRLKAVAEIFDLKW